MILLVFTATLLVLGSTYYQYRTESDQYNSYRQERKESQLKRQINFIVNKYDLSNNYDKWGDYANDFEEITKIHSVEYSIFTTEGSPLFYSYLPLEVISNNYSLDIDFVKMLVSNEEGKFTSENFTDVGKFQSSYSVLQSDVGEKYAILFFPYFQDVSFAESELNVFLSTLYQIYFIMLVVAIVLAYFISRFVTRSIETIRLKIGQTGLLKKNEKIYLNNATKEIDSLVNSYNKMIDDLEDSAQRLAKTEREQAWQEMAKQVAHEIKNPLTPMRLTVQSFQKNNGLNSDEEKLKLNDFCEMWLLLFLILQLFQRHN
jgi:signal transduction histidine kinase